MKFSDVILAVSIASVVGVLLDFVLLAVFVPVNSYWASDIAGIPSILVASLIAGYVFALQIQEESRMKAVGKIVALLALVQSLGAMVAFSGNSYYGAFIKETLQSMYSTGAWTTVDWFAYVQLAMVMNVAFNVVLMVVFGFIGLYAGSMLKKPKKT